MVVIKLIICDAALPYNTCGIMMPPSLRLLPFRMFHQDMHSPHVILGVVCLSIAIRRAKIAHPP